MQKYIANGFNYAIYLCNVQEPILSLTYFSCVNVRLRNAAVLKTGVFYAAPFNIIKMRIDLRFTEQEKNTLLHYFGRHGINNRTLFVKEHFWRSFAQYTDEGINENVKIIREQAAQIEFLSRQNSQILKALAVGLLSSVDSKTRLKMNSLLDGMIDTK